MSGLRFFADEMNSLIAADRRSREAEERLMEITRNAETYTEKCKELRQKHLPARTGPCPSFYAATEGLNAARIILRKHQ